MKAPNAKIAVYLIVMVILTNISIEASNREDSIKYFDTNYFDVLNLASKDGKMMFIDFWGVWCGACKTFNDKIKPDSLFKDYIKKHFYTIQINSGLEENKAVVSKYHVQYYPTFVITDSLGEEIGRIIGLSENKPEKFIGLVEKIIQGKESMELLKQQFVSNPDSLELFNKIIYEQLLGKQLYKSAIEFSDYAIAKTNNPSLKEEADYSKAYSLLYDKDLLSPKAMTDFINNTKNSHYIESGSRELYWFYDRLSNTDSVNYYLGKLVSLSSDAHLGYVRDYARFLYKQNLNIPLANQLTKEYTETEGYYEDHWTPYLKANQLARQGKLKKAIKLFDDWMPKYSIKGIKEDYWHYQFYIDFVLFYKVSSNKAIKYARMLEDYNPDISNKKQLAEIYFLNGKKSPGIKKLKEINNIIEDPKEKINIDDFMKSHISISNGTKHL